MFIPAHKDYTITPIWAETNGLDVVVRWAYHGTFTPVFKVFLNGVEYATTKASYITVTGLTAGKSYRFDVLALSPMETSLNFSANIFIPAQGSKLKLTIPQADLTANPDFDSYLIFWSIDGTEPTTLLRELKGVNNNVYATADLEDGITYKFRVKLKDIYGNTSAYGPTIAGTVNTLPQGVTSSISYNQTTRAATITAVKPAQQDADVVGYVLYSNDLPGYGLQEYPCNPVTYWHAAQSLSYVTQELGAGHNKWCIRAIDKSGLESDYSTLELNLTRSGGNLIVATNPPAKPTYIDAIPIAGGAVRVKVRISDPAHTTRVNVYRDGALDGFVLTGAAYEYTYTTAALTHGHTYAFTATSLNGTAESPLTKAVTATADGQAPTGNLALSLELL